MTKNLPTKGVIGGNIGGTLNSLCIYQIEMQCNIGGT